MKRILLTAVAGALFLFSLQNCKHEVPKITSTTPRTVSHTCSLDTVYFVNDILPIILSNCAQSGCHDAITREDDVQLTDYDNIIETGDVEKGDANKSKLYQALFDDDEVMPPPPGSLSPEQKNAIRIWINQGAKNNECKGTCDTLDITYSGNVWPIIESTCKGCHTPGNAQGGVLLTKYSEVKSLVDAGTLQNVLERNGPKTPMPPGGALEECAHAQIKIWIREGAQDN